MSKPDLSPLEVAHLAFQEFSDGLATGNWNRFLERLTDDFSFWFPSGTYHGLNQGKPRAEEFFRYVTTAFNPGLTVILDGVTSNETTVVFELRSEGRLNGQPYKNRVAVAFDIREDKVCGYREYFGSDGKSY